MNPSIYILAGDISYNRGDLMSLSAQIGDLRRHYPQAHITACALDPDLCDGMVDAHIIQRGILPTYEQWQHIRTSDLVVWGGGALLADHSCRLLIPYWLAMLLLIRFIAGKKIVGVSHGVVLKTRLGRLLARFACAIPNSIACRDYASLEALRTLRIPTKLHLTADYALLMQAGAAMDESTQHALQGIEGNVIAVPVTFWHLYNSTRSVLPYIFRRRLGFHTKPDGELMQRYKEGLAALADALVAKYDCHVRFIPRYTDSQWDDIRHLQEVQSQCKNPERILVFTELRMKPAQYISFLRAHRGVISVPFHDTIAALHAGVPHISLTNEEKGAGLMRSLKASERCMGWENLFAPGGTEEIMRLYESTEKQWPALSHQDKHALATLAEAAQRNTQLILLHLK